MRFLFLCILLLTFSCSEPGRTEIDNPFPSNSMFPNLFKANGKVYLSYLHSKGDTLDELYFSSFDGVNFSEPRKIIEGRNWFVNWADIPAIAVNGSDLLVSWLDKSASGTYDYDVKMSLSHDEGRNWSPPFIPHKDGIAAEHGFVSLTDDFQAIWLDGRDTLNKQMTLRSAIIDHEGNMRAELEIDGRVCDCCQTAQKKTSIGTFALYRNRSEDEIRDHYFSIFMDTSWSDPMPIHADNWKIGGCPVNGPVIDSYQDQITAAWYTEANGQPEVYLAQFKNEEGRFAKPILISGENVIGRLDLQYISKDRFIVIWMETSDKNMAVIRGNIYGQDATLLEQIELGSTASARSSGFPKIEILDGKLFLVYTKTKPEMSLVTKVVEL